MKDFKRIFNFFWIFKLIVGFCNHGNGAVSPCQRESFAEDAVRLVRRRHFARLLSTSDTAPGRGSRPPSASGGRRIDGCYIVAAHDTPCTSYP